MPPDQKKYLAAREDMSRALASRAKNLEAIPIPKQMSPADRDMAREALLEAAGILKDASERILTPLAKVSD